MDAATNGTDDDESVVPDPVHPGRVYRFNRFGQHVATVNSETETPVYSFAYSKNTAFGKLSRAEDGLGNKLHFKRDYTNRVQSVENILGHKFGVRLSLLGHLEGLELAPSHESKVQIKDAFGTVSEKPMVITDKHSFININIFFIF